MSMPSDRMAKAAAIGPAAGSSPARPTSCRGASTNPKSPGCGKITRTANRQIDPHRPHPSRARPAGESGPGPRPHHRLGSYIDAVHVNSVVNLPIGSTFYVVIFGKSTRRASSRYVQPPRQPRVDFLGTRPAHPEDRVVGGRHPTYDRGDRRPAHVNRDIPARASHRRK